MKWPWQCCMLTFSVYLVHSWQSIVPFSWFPNYLGRLRQRQRQQQGRFQTICIPLPTKDHYNDTAADTAAHHQVVVDSFVMQMALSQAQKAADRGEVPIGAVVVRPLPVIPSASSTSSTDTTTTDTINLEILSMASNHVEEWHDASAHAELVALRQAAHRLQTWRLLNATLYTTVEPCPLCLAAAQGFRIHRIVYGAPDYRVGAIDSYLQLLQGGQHPYHNIHHVTRGVEQNASATMLRTFFRQRRQEQKESKKTADVVVVADATAVRTTLWKRIIMSWRRRRNKRE
jgi:tRNA(adenine34) deaminase